MRFVGKRLMLFVAALIGLSVLVFVMLRVLPGDVAAVIAGTNATPERIASLRAELAWISRSSHNTVIGYWAWCMVISVCPQLAASRSRSRLRHVPA